MTDQPVCLTLIVPDQLREELLDYLTDQTDLVSGFTAAPGAGHGAGVRLQTAAERVKGHADQTAVQIILARSDASNLLDRLRASFGGGDGVRHDRLTASEIRRHRQEQGSRRALRQRGEARHAGPIVGITEAANVVGLEPRRAL
ncbi:MAG: DUF3240 family protein [Bradyrhizobium sp.]|uniref:DUF3240 family protein n=1 Tax=Bradyrhizobium sp. TaxID=376 RepID=UPI003BF01F5A